MSSSLPAPDDLAEWTLIVKQLEGMVRRSTGNRDLAAEVSSEVICQALVAEANGKRIGLGWLVVRCRGLMVDTLKKRSRDLKLSQQELELMRKSMLMRNNDPTLEVARAEQLLRVPQILDEILGELDPLDHDLVVMKYVDGLSYAQILSRLPMNESTAKGRVARALEKVRQRLEAEGRLEALRGMFHHD